MYSARRPHFPAFFELAGFACGTQSWSMRGDRWTGERLHKGNMSLQKATCFLPIPLLSFFLFPPWAEDLMVSIPTAILGLEVIVEMEALYWVGGAERGSPGLRYPWSCPVSTGLTLPDPVYT